ALVVVEIDEGRIDRMSSGGGDGFARRRGANHHEIASAEEHPDCFDDVRLIVSDEHTEWSSRAQPANRLGGGTFKNGSFNRRHKNDSSAGKDDAWMVPGGLGPPRHHPPASAAGGRRNSGPSAYACAGEPTLAVNLGARLVRCWQPAGEGPQGG